VSRSRCRVDKAEAAEIHQARVGHELGQMGAQRAAMEAYLDQVKREQGLQRQIPEPAPATLPGNLPTQQR
jgi:hypothetical protein